MKVTNTTELFNLNVEGFRSYHSATSLTLDGRGLVLVKGDNGYGKSTLFEAIVWVLYKKTLKNTVNEKVQTWQRIRTPEYRGTRVVLMLWSNGFYYMIARHLNFTGTTKGLKGGNKLLIYRRSEDFNFTGEDLVGEAHHKGDQEAYIQQILGMDSRTFLNSMLFAQRAVRLVSAEPEEKRKLFDTLFDLDFVEAAKTKAAGKQTQYNLDITKLDTEINALNNKITNDKANYTRNKEILDTFTRTKKERIIAVETKLANKEKELAKENEVQAQLKKDLAAKQGEADIEAITKEYKEAKAKLDTNNNTAAEYEREIKGLQQQLDQSKNRKEQLLRQSEEVNTVCPTCEQPLKADKVKAAKKSLKDQAEREDSVISVLDGSIKTKKGMVAQLDADYYAINGDYEAAKVKYDALDTIKVTIAKLESNIQVSIGTVQRLNREIQDLKVEVDTEQKAVKPNIDLVQLQQDIDADTQLLQDKSVKYSEITDKLTKTQWWIKKAFGAGGLKSFVFSAMLAKLNVHIDTYAVRLGFKCKFWIDLDKANKPFMTTIYEGTNEIDYNELSGGQKQLLDVTVAFAMHDLVTELSQINVLILDEIFEGLSPVNVEAVFDLIRMKADSGISVFVVTHSQVIDSLGSHAMYVGYTPEKHSYILE